MPKDVIITPASGLVDFKDTSGNIDASIQLNDIGNLVISNPGGTLTIGNTASNLYVGDGINSVDIIFEQNGKVRALSNKTLTLGQSDSYVTANAPFGFLSPDGTKQITARMLNTDVLSFQGGAGELLSLSDSMSGTIFSVNDVSGIPSIEVLDTGLIKLAQYSGNVAVGKATANSKVDIDGTITSTSFSGSGQFLSSLNASNLTSGTVSTARLASGTANSSTYLRGDGTWSSITGVASSSRLTYTATAGQTVFTAPQYVIGANQVSVFINGVKQYPTDYNETSQTSITLTTGAILNDVVLIEVNGYGSYTGTAPINITGSAAYITGTNIGRTGSQGFISTTGWTSADWANQPISGLGMTISNTPGAPNTNYGFFNKFGNRDAGGPGWGGMWMEYNGGSLWYGSTTVSSSFATWKQVLDTTNSTSTNIQFNSLGVGTAASGTTGEIRATNSITAHYSDKRLKNIIRIIPNALDKVLSLSGVLFTQNEKAEEFGYHDYQQQVGVIAQEVQQVLPEAIKPAPFDIDKNGESISGENYLTVQYEKLVPLLIEAIKDQQKQIDELKSRIKSNK